MKRILLLLFVALVSVSACKKKQENILTAIGERKEKINKDLPKYTAREVDDLISKEPGKIKGYFRDDEAKKIQTQHFGRDSRKFTEYYFDDGMLIYVALEEYVYNRPNNYTEEIAKEAGDSVWYDDTKSKLEINRYYFDDNKLIKWTGPSSSDVPVNIAEFTQREPMILAQALIALKQLKAD